MVDLQRIQRRLELLRTYRSRLDVLRRLPVDEYVEEEAFTGRYLVQAAAQVCIDVASHLIASEGWRAPRDFRDSFTVLREQGVLDADLAGRLAALAGLRNRLVHLYDEVDDELVHEALDEGLDDFDGFARAVARFLSCAL